MGKILLVNQDENLLELMRISLEEVMREEVLIASTPLLAIALMHEHNFRLIVSDNQSSILFHLIEQDTIMPFLFFTDDINIEIPFTSKMFIGVWRTNQFEDMRFSIAHLLKS